MWTLCGQFLIHHFLLACICKSNTVSLLVWYLVKKCKSSSWQQKHIYVRHRKIKKGFRQMQLVYISTIKSATFQPFGGVGVGGWRWGGGSSVMSLQTCKKMWMDFLTSLNELTVTVLASCMVVYERKKKKKWKALAWVVFSVLFKWGSLSMLHHGKNVLHPCLKVPTKLLTEILVKKQSAREY